MKSPPRSFDDYAPVREELRERWRLRLKLELLIEKVHGRDVNEVKAQLSSRYQRISRQARDMTDERLCGIYLNCLTALYDPHSSYLTPSFESLFNQTVSVDTYTCGLGLRERTGSIVITAVHPSLRNRAIEGDLIGSQVIAVRRLDGTIVDLVEMHMDDVFKVFWMSEPPLESDTEIILELLDPVTLKRTTLSWNRFRKR